MITFITLLLVFIYFKIARVHKKEEQLNRFFIVMHTFVALSILFLFLHAFLTYEWYMVVGMSLLFFVVAALGVTVIQLGIFVEGKPLLGIGTVYKYLPILAGSIIILTIGIYNL